MFAIDVGMSPLFDLVRAFWSALAPAEEARVLCPGPDSSARANPLPADQEQARLAQLGLVEAWPHVDRLCVEVWSVTDKPAIAGGGQPWSPYDRVGRWCAPLPLVPSERASSDNPVAT
jgi:hypothetical protein